MASAKASAYPLKSNETAGGSSPGSVKAEKSKGKKISRVVIHYDVGFSNSIYIRGKGANLSWDKGIILHNEGPDQWVWETELPFQTVEFKVLVNDGHYEQGENHTLVCEKCLEYTPLFE